MAVISSKKDSLDWVEVWGAEFSLAAALFAFFALISSKKDSLEVGMLRDESGFCFVIVPPPPNKPLSLALMASLLLVWFPITAVASVVAFDVVLTVSVLLPCKQLLRRSRKFSLPLMILPMASGFILSSFGTTTVGSSLAFRIVSLLAVNFPPCWHVFRMLSMSFFPYGVETWWVIFSGEAAGSNGPLFVSP